MRFPVNYREGQPFDVSLDDLEFQVPDVEPRRWSGNWAIGSSDPYCRMANIAMSSPGKNPEYAFSLLQYTNTQFTITLTYGVFIRTKVNTARLDYLKRFTEVFDA